MNNESKLDAGAESSDDDDFDLVQVHSDFSSEDEDEIPTDSKGLKAQAMDAVTGDLELLKAVTGGSLPAGTETKTLRDNALQLLLPAWSSFTVNVSADVTTRLFTADRKISPSAQQTVRAVLELVPAFPRWIVPTCRLSWVRSHAWRFDYQCAARRDGCFTQFSVSGAATDCTVWRVLSNGERCKHIAGGAYGQLRGMKRAYMQRLNLKPTNLQLAGLAQLPAEHLLTGRRDAVPSASAAKAISAMNARGGREDLFAAVQHVRDTLKLPRSDRQPQYDEVGRLKQTAAAAQAKVTGVIHSVELDPVNVLLTTEAHIRLWAKLAPREPGVFFDATGGLVKPVRGDRRVFSFSMVVPNPGGGSALPLFEFVTDDSTGNGLLSMMARFDNLVNTVLDKQRIRPCRITMDCGQNQMVFLCQYLFTETPTEFLTRRWRELAQSEQPPANKQTVLNWCMYHVLNAVRTYTSSSKLKVATADSRKLLRRFALAIIRSLETAPTFKRLLALIKGARSLLATQQFALPASTGRFVQYLPANDADGIELVMVREQQRVTVDISPSGISFQLDVSPNATAFGNVLFNLQLREYMQAEWFDRAPLFAQLATGARAHRTDSIVENVWRSLKHVDEGGSRAVALPVYLSRRGPRMERELLRFTLVATAAKAAQHRKTQLQQPEGGDYSETWNRSPQLAVEHHALAQRIASIAAKVLASLHCIGVLMCCSQLKKTEQITQETFSTMITTATGCTVQRSVLNQFMLKRYTPNEELMAALTKYADLWDATEAKQQLAGAPGNAADSKAAADDGKAERENAPSVAAANSSSRVAFSQPAAVARRSSSRSTATNVSWSALNALAKSSS